MGSDNTKRETVNSHDVEGGSGRGSTPGDENEIRSATTTTATAVDGMAIPGIGDSSMGIASRRSTKRRPPSSSSSSYSQLQHTSEKEDDDDDDDDDDDSDNESDMSFESDDSDVQVIKEPLLPKWVSWTGLVANTTLLLSQARHLGVPEGQMAPPLDGSRIVSILSQVGNDDDCDDSWSSGLSCTGYYYIIIMIF